MRGYRLRAKLALLAIAGAFAVGLASANASTTHENASLKPITGDTPAVVAQGRASLVAPHNPNDVLRLNVGLGVHNSAQLDAVIRAASAPGRRHGHYLTNAQYMARYAPTSTEVRAVRAWLSNSGLVVTGVSPDNLLIHAQTTVRGAEQAFAVAINDYTYNGRTFYANDRDPNVPSGLNISWVSGLNNYDVFKAARSAVASNGGLEGSDFRTAYDISGNGSGRTIGFTLWGETLPQSDYDGYAAATGTTKLTVGGSGDDGLQFIQVGGSTTESDTDGEVALDTEVAHATAPSIHETYWLGHDNSNSTLETVINDAANSGLPLISNSWGCNGCSIDSNMESSLQHAASVGTTFYFSSGDSGAAAGRSYPAVSQYVVAVGGTNLNIDNSSNYVSETGWSGSGGGCDNSETRPSWQTGISGELVYPSGTCTGRAEPDVAADSNSCAYVFVDGADNCFIGTSLSAPLWAAMATVWDNNNLGSGRPTLGFSAPLIYALANDPTTYANDFHDITSGSNGFSAGTGWDEVTGWGSPDFNKISNNIPDVTYTGPTQASKGDTITLKATLLDHNASTILATAALGTLQVSLTAAGDSCTANVDSSGNASCNVTITANPGHYKAIAAYAGDAAYGGGSQTVNFTVLHIPTKITYAGATSGDYHDPVKLSATLSEDITGGLPIASEPLMFTLGAESCSGVTDSSGSASCSVTPASLADVPGAYTVKVSFAGDEPLYEPSNTTAAFTLNKEETTAAYTGPTVILAGASTATLTGTLVEDGANDTDSDGGSPGPIPSEQVTLSLGTQSCTAMTDPSGGVSCQIPSVTVPLGTQTASADFAGDPYYLPSHDSKTVTVFAFPNRGAFVLGDQTVAGAGSSTVTWWSDNWYLLNSLSGGIAPASFKGFAGTVTLPTTTPANVCGTTFTTNPGNSPPPTSGVPSYMGVLVASSVTKSGSTITGTWAHIVVVKTNPGYAPNPGSPGTGTIIATFC
jgi:kumamolisin